VKISTALTILTSTIIEKIKAITVVAEEKKS